ncbi:NGG1p interacting factor 3 [Epithele typhae]|uniref:NGG1p interacting factor 3 n=1 Tax=Epithele typhae TaxID=378194 RepID=UPI002008657D|nr:NGG1p interacting factor 3 [Epithele typhae]KAH9943999.1 NGG1p interacting factor 3 [Epithele typhae]
MSLVKGLCRIMERIAPLRFAEKWDNVGLILEAPHVRPNANRVLLTIDLTPAVVQEALDTPTSFIVSYHPPIFKPLTSLTLANPLQTSLLKCAAAGISIYTPHTALDSVTDGINDWLCSRVAGPLRDIAWTSRFIGQAFPDDLGGVGRVMTLKEPVSFGLLHAKIRQELELKDLQVAYASPEKDRAMVSSVAICAGSGGSMLLGVDADVYFTGEMSHHEVLAAIQSGHNVVLCGHTNTERGYLPWLAKDIEEFIQEELAQPTDPAEAEFLKNLEVVVSTKDEVPLVTTSQ